MQKHRQHLHRFQGIMFGEGIQQAVASALVVLATAIALKHLGESHHKPYSVNHREI